MNVIGAGVEILLIEKQPLLNIELNRSAGNCHNPTNQRYRISIQSTSAVSNKKFKSLNLHDFILMIIFSVVFEKKC